MPRCSRRWPPAQRIFELLDTHTEVHRSARRRGHAARRGAASSSATSASRTPTATARTRARRRLVPRQGRRDHRDRRPERRRQDAPWSTCCRASTTSPAGPSSSTTSTSATSRSRSLRAQIGLVTQETRAVRRHHRAQHRLRPSRGVGRGDRGGGPCGARPRVHRDAAGARTRRGSASGAAGSAAGSASGWRSPARCSRTRRSSSSTKPPRRSTPSPSGWCRTRCRR